MKSIQWKNFIAIMAEFLSAAAGKGGSRMETAATDIDEISSFAEFLRDIVIVIGSLLSRINLPDMNPGIKAAHTGNAGRGTRGLFYVCGSDAGRLTFLRRL